MTTQLICKPIGPLVATSNSDGTRKVVWSYAMAPSDRLRVTARAALVTTGFNCSFPVIGDAFARGATGNTSRVGGAGATPFDARFASGDDAWILDTSINADNITIELGVTVPNGTTANVVIDGDVFGSNNGL